MKKHMGSNGWQSYICEKCDKPFNENIPITIVHHGVIESFQPLPISKLIEFNYTPSSMNIFYHKACFTDDPPQVGSILDKIKELVNTLNDKEANEIYKYLYYGPRRCRL